MLLMKPTVIVFLGCVNDELFFDVLLKVSRNGVRIADLVNDFDSFSEKLVYFK
jgi:hypothetical protein